MKVTPAGLALGAVGLAAGTVLVVSLREATLSTHAPAAPGSQTRVVVTARAHHAEEGHTLDEMVEAQLLACRLEVSADVGAIEAEGDGRFRVVLTPALDETDRRQFRGCVEDWLIDGVQIDVVELAG